MSDLLWTVFHLLSIWLMFAFGTPGLLMATGNKRCQDISEQWFDAL